MTLLGFEAAKPKKQREDDQPSTQPIRASSAPAAQRRNLTAEEKSFKRRRRVTAAYSGPGYYLVDKDGTPQSEPFASVSEAQAQVKPDSGHLVQYLNQAPDAAHIAEPFPPNLQQVNGSLMRFASRTDDEFIFLASSDEEAEGGEAEGGGEEHPDCEHCHHAFASHGSVEGGPCEVCACEHYDGGEGGEEGGEKEASLLPPGMTFQQREAQILRAMASATLPQQQALLGELDGLRRQARRQVEAEREIDLSSAVIRDHLTPVMVHEHHTASTDWIDDVAEGGMDRTAMHHQMVAEARIWANRVSPAVRADRQEYLEQARGVARRVASAMGVHANEAFEVFMKTAAPWGDGGAPEAAIAPWTAPPMQLPPVGGGDAPFGVPTGGGPLNGQNFNPMAEEVYPGSQVLPLDNGASAWPPADNLEGEGPLPPVAPDNYNSVGTETHMSSRRHATEVPQRHQAPMPEPADIRERVERWNSTPYGVYGDEGHGDDDQYHRDYDFGYFGQPHGMERYPGSSYHTLRGYDDREAGNDYDPHAGIDLPDEDEDYGHEAARRTARRVAAIRDTGDHLIETNHLPEGGLNWTVTHKTSGQVLGSGTANNGDQAHAMAEITILKNHGRLNGTYEDYMRERAQEAAQSRRSANSHLANSGTFSGDSATTVSCPHCATVAKRGEKCPGCHYPIPHTSSRRQASEAFNGPKQTYADYQARLSEGAFPMSEDAFAGSMAAVSPAPSNSTLPVTGMVRWAERGIDPDPTGADLDKNPMSGYGDGSGYNKDEAHAQSGEAQTSLPLAPTGDKVTENLDFITDFPNTGPTEVPSDRAFNIGGNASGDQDEDARNDAFKESLAALGVRDDGRPLDEVPHPFQRYASTRYCRHCGEQPDFPMHVEAARRLADKVPGRGKDQEGPDFEPNRGGYAMTPEGDAQASQDFEQAYSSDRHIDYSETGIGQLGTVPVQGYGANPNGEMFAWTVPPGPGPVGAADVGGVPTPGAATGGYPQPQGIEAPEGKEARLRAAQARVRANLGGRQ